MNNLTSTPERIEIRDLNQMDLSAVAQIHMLAFTESALTALGIEAVRRYYEWQLTGPHNVSALGACYGNELAGFYFGGVFRGAMSGYLKKNRKYLLWRVLTHPWLAFNPIFRDRLLLAIKLIRKFSRPRSAPEQADKIKIHPFGILSVSVSPKFQGKGVGRMLMAEAESIAIERGYEEMRLSVNSANQQAIRFYEGLGWNKEIKESTWSGDMIKRLVP